MAAAGLPGFSRCARGWMGPPERRGYYTHGESWAGLGPGANTDRPGSDGIRYIKGMVAIRAAMPTDADALWAILAPVIRAGETYTLPREIAREAALAWWLAPAHEVFLAEENGEAVGTYFLRANQQGGGA